MSQSKPKQNFAAAKNKSQILKKSQTVKAIKYLSFQFNKSIQIKLLTSFSTQSNQFRKPDPFGAFPTTLNALHFWPLAYCDVLKLGSVAKKRVEKEKKTHEKVTSVVVGSKNIHRPKRAVGQVYVCSSTPKFSR